MSPIPGDLDVEVREAPPFETVVWIGCPYAIVSLVLAGSAMDGETILVPGSVTYRPSGLAERLTFGANGGTLVRIGVAPDRLVPFGLTHLQRARIANYAASGERIRREMHRGDTAAALALRSAALHIVGLAIRQFGRGTPPSWLMTAREVIASRFRERIRPADIAASVGVAPAKLARAFRRELGASVTSAIRSARVDAAVRELRESTASTATIAAHCGFYDASHLIRSLEATHGVTPAAFRESGSW